ncbi:S-adenosyl-L-methionine-dependent methyltransferase [Trichoderma barbatum]
MALFDSYVLGRDLNASVRLDSLHLLFRMYNGYTLSPNIPTSSNMKIAEIGTGTGMWLLDVASQCPPTIQLDGFDISGDQFPHKSALPNNVTLSIMDAFGQVPEELHGKYDVVHMRLWSCIIRSNETDQLIHHVTQLLKPGGYLQWDEADIGKTVANGVEAVAFWKIMGSILQSINIDSKWIEEIPNRLQEQGMSAIDVRVGCFSQLLVPLVTRTYLCGYNELLKSIYKEGAVSLPHRIAAEEALFRLMESHKRGDALYWTPVTVIARKQVAI